MCRHFVAKSIALQICEELSWISIQNECDVQWIGQTLISLQCIENHKTERFIHHTFWTKQILLLKKVSHPMYKNLVRFHLNKVRLLHIQKKSSQIGSLLLLPKRPQHATLRKSWRFDVMPRVILSTLLLKQLFHT